MVMHSLNSQHLEGGSRKLRSWRPAWAMWGLFFKEKEGREEEGRKDHCFVSTARKLSVLLPPHPQVWVQMLSVPCIFLSNLWTLGALTLSLSLKQQCEVQNTWSDCPLMRILRKPLLQTSLDDQYLTALKSTTKSSCFLSGNFIILLRLTNVYKIQIKSLN